MAILYVANTSKQHHHFYYRLPEEPTARYEEIRIGTQARIGGEDLSLEIINRIIKQHEPYGLKAESDLGRTRGYVGLCYSIDKPVKMDSLLGAFESNDKALNERAEDLREETAVAVANGIQSTLEASGGTMNRAEVETVEDTRGTPSVATGYETTREGVEPRHTGGRQATGGRRNRR